MQIGKPVEGRKKKSRLYIRSVVIKREKKLKESLNVYLEIKLREGAEN
jgi:hypothetical protein